jgi:ketosteroid isomerase-like protein
MKNSALDVALGFVDRINRHDLGGLVALMTDDHRFVDGLGQEVRGREHMEKGWLGYFAWFPDYTIKVDDAMSNGNVVAMFGSAQGTYAGKANLGAEAHWEIPAAWKAVVRDESVSEWQVYADNEPVWKVMGVKRF